MKLRWIAILIWLSLTSAFYRVPDGGARPGGDSAAAERDVSASLPAKDRFSLLSYRPLVAGSRVFGTIAVYDDVNTRRTVDYVEIYDNAGFLVAVSWYDRFGIERLAVERALLENAESYNGSFVLILRGRTV